MKTSRLGLPVKQQKRWTEATLGPLDQAHTHSARATVQTPRKPRLTTHKQYPIPLIAVKRMAGGRESPHTISLSGREGESRRSQSLSRDGRAGTRDWVVARLSYSYNSPELTSRATWRRGPGAS